MDPPRLDVGLGRADRPALLAPLVVINYLYLTLCSFPNSVGEEWLSFLWDINLFLSFSGLITWIDLSGRTFLLGLGKLPFSLKKTLLVSPISSSKGISRIVAWGAKRLGMLGLTQIVIRKSPKGKEGQHGKLIGTIGGLNKNKTYNEIKEKLGFAGSVCIIGPGQKRMWVRMRNREISEKRTGEECKAEGGGR